MRVTFDQSIAWREGIHVEAYARGETAELDDALAKQYIDAGICRPARGRPALDERAPAPRRGKTPERAIAGPDETERLV